MKVSENTRGAGGVERALRQNNALLSLPHATRRFDSISDCIKRTLGKVLGARRKARPRLTGRGVV
jgi:hypothetical protein